MIIFPDSPNAITPMGEPAYVSRCGHFRLFEAAGSWWPHYRLTKRPESQWMGGFLDCRTTHAARPLRRAER
jgi:hypothetical protein